MSNREQEPYRLFPFDPIWGERETWTEMKSRLINTMYYDLARRVDGDNQRLFDMELKRRGEHG